MSEFLSSKTKLTWEPPRVRSFPAPAASVTAMVGVAEKGPVGQAVLCQTFEDYLRIFGGFSGPATLALSALCFFQNGGTSLHVVRTAHYTKLGDAATSTARRAHADMVSAAGKVATVFASSAGIHGNKIGLTLHPSADAFDVTVECGNKVVETHRRVTLQASAPRNLASVLRRDSAYVTVEIDDAASGQLPVAQGLMLEGGDDGLAGLTEDDLIGNAAAGTGLYALDGILDLSVVCIPGLTSATGQHALMHYCSEHRGDLFAVLDAPRTASAGDVVKHVTEGKLEGASEQAAMYWPWVRIRSPDREALGAAAVDVPPCAAVAGSMARAAAARPGGVYAPAAGIEMGQLHGVVGFDHDDCLHERRRDLVFPHRVNPLTTGPGLPFFIDGSRTLKAGGASPSSHMPGRRPRLGAGCANAWNTCGIARLPAACARKPSAKQRAI